MLIFQNPGLIDMVAATTSGISAKKDDTAIGQFGTGLKYAVAVVLRLGGRISVVRGKKTYVFGLHERTIRGTKHRIVTMNGRMLGYTDHLGMNWEPWMAYRELWSNARDEGGRVIREDADPDAETRYARAGQTSVIVRCPQLDAAHEDRASIILQTEPLVTCGGIEVHDGQSQHVYYRGIRVARLPSNRTSRYTYNITSPQRLTEDRTLAYSWMIPAVIMQGLVKCTSESVLRRVMAKVEDDFEGKLPWEDARSYEPSPQFLRIGEELLIAKKLNGNLAGTIRHLHDVTPGYRSPFEVNLGAVEQGRVRDAEAVLDSRLPPGWRVMLPQHAMKFRSRMDGGRATWHPGESEIRIHSGYLSGTVAELASALLSGYLRAIVGSDRVEHALASVLIQGTIPTPDEFDALRRLTKAVGSVPEFDDEEPVPVPY